MKLCRWKSFCHRRNWSFWQSTPFKYAQKQSACVAVFLSVKKRVATCSVLIMPAVALKILPLSLPTRYPEYKKIIHKIAPLFTPEWNIFIFKRVIFGILIERIKFKATFDDINNYVNVNHEYAKSNVCKKIIFHGKPFIFFKKIFGLPWKIVFL